MRLPFLPACISLRNPAPRKQLDEEQSCKETTNMCGKCDAPRLMVRAACGRNRVEELAQEPKPQPDPRRQPPEEDEEDPSEHLRSWKEQEVSSHHSRNGAACPDHRNIRRWSECDIGQCGRYSADEIEDQIRKMAKIVFDVVTKDPENPHIAENVKKTPVHEHGSQDGENIGAQRILRQAGNGADKVVRYQSELLDQKVHRTRPLGLNRQFHEEIHCDIEPYDEVVYEGRAEPGLVIFDGKHARRL